MAQKNTAGIWVAGPGERLDRSQRDENKIANKLSRGETLSGPFAASPSGQAQQKAIMTAQQAQIDALTKQVNALLIKAGVMPDPAKA